MILVKYKEKLKKKMREFRQEAEEGLMMGRAGIEARMQKYALTPMQMDLRGYSDREKALLGELLKAAELAELGI